MFHTHFFLPTAKPPSLPSMWFHTTDLDISRGAVHPSWFTAAYIRFQAPQQAVSTPNLCQFDEQKCLFIQLLPSASLWRAPTLSMLPQHTALVSTVQPPHRVFIAGCAHSHTQESSFISCNSSVCHTSVCHFERSHTNLRLIKYV